jgi:hypothetical protein
MTLPFHPIWIPIAVTVALTAFAWTPVRGRDDWGVVTAAKLAGCIATAIICWLLYLAYQMGAATS